MKIQIREKLRPFSHLAGSACPLPGTFAIVQAFPTLLRIDQHEIPIEKGHHEGFTLQMDLEKHCVFVFGKKFRLQVYASENGFHVRGSMRIDIRTPVVFCPAAPFERLSLGNRKAQDWEGVLKRGDMAEWMPCLFCLGQKVPRVKPQKLTGTAHLLKMSDEKSLQALFQAGFSKLLVPRLNDDQHQGLVPYEKEEGSPFYLLQEGAKLIRSLFFQQDERRIAFLPALLTSLHAGKMVGLKAPGIGTIDFEWSKKQIRSAYIRAAVSGEILLEVKAKTVRVNRRERVSTKEPLCLHEGKTYLLDRFEK